MIATLRGSSSLQETLKLACDGTSVSVKELYQVLNQDDLVNIKEGELTVDDLRAIVFDLADSKDNTLLYRLPQRNSEPIDLM